ncbi:hypothetical protein [Ralstonia pseudosolanacearum]|uniref:hypothetical protein n=1 Tax=Ralstonia pseudosolanacearum TaxID=1310165 RepID=UPI0011600D37|nr:hypothetical protein [Ralstonia pseudosolanacearum]NKA09977.1 hypothetical protein [Ralstonia solanacearum]QWF60367.1 hypothetical protein KM864_14500 [Ralstonia solanacearum]TXD89021.1 hypothetical protein FUT89_13105 [Ralstonia pseudosolanacearum]BCM03394.1 hypothetical protein MAFF301560_27810 [Ralstonia solanacearum]BEU45853.1 hypothetical protein MAFF211519_11780 [Ralstonia pseudosolanacearum]
MKTHEFAKHLEQLARLLRQMPDVELDSKLTSGMQGLLPGMAAADKGKKPQARRLPDGIEAQLQNLSPAEIEAYLSSEDGAFTVANLSELAARLGLSVSKRQSKSALVNVITRHYEAGKMHSIIRDTRPNDA